MTDPATQLLTASLDLRIGGADYCVQVTVPAGDTTAAVLLPLARELDALSIAAGVELARAQGRTVTCRAGCGACCRQLVPVTPTEAQYLADLVAALPEPEQARVRERFAAALATLERAGMLDALRAPERLVRAEGRALALAYFGLGVPCPFLVDESCSIHPQRPLICREYLVSSRAEHCAEPTREQVESVDLPVRVSVAIGRLGLPADARHAAWVPLVLALEPAAGRAAPRAPGPDLLRAFLHGLTGQSIEPPPGMAV